MRSTLQAVVTAQLVFASLVFSSVAAESESQRFVREVAPILDLLSGENDDFSVLASANFPIDGKAQTVDVRLDRFDEESFDLAAAHPDFAVHIRRRADATAMALPKHKVVFLGKGEIDGQDRLAPQGIIKRLISPQSSMSAYASLATEGDPLTVSLLLRSLLKMKFDTQADHWTAGEDVSIRFDTAKRSVEVKSNELDVELSHGECGQPAAVDDWPGMKIVELPREELERQLARGARRALEILAPSPLLTSPSQTNRVAEHGELRWIGGQRVVLLKGTPEQVGAAHGELLKIEAQRCVDSVLHTFGTVQTIRTGRWFRHELEAAYKRLSPYIPDDHKRETRAMAASLDMDPQLVEAVNVFPEMFHCSGFAVFGKATKDGKLYHGRVLDYMTTIGLQDAATTFIVAVDGKIPFANVGYAGFIGSVSGMNTKAISLGEMGGRGEGDWDGVPMATLMRRALEECSTLDEVMDLWKNNPRTCEYYYVFADGKTNRAVGVAALPESVEFIQPGQSHARLGEGIEDVVVLSAGSRLEKLRERVMHKHGQIDAATARWLMSRPVAMESNLHNVLFVPQDGVLYVANADHRRPAAERPYVRIDLLGLLQSTRQDQGN